MQAKLQISSVTIGSPNPHELARFYAKLLGAEVSVIENAPVGEPQEAGWAQIRTTSELGTLSLNFEYEHAWREIRWPAEPDRQHITQHLDIVVDDLDAAVNWATACGARLADQQFQDDVRVMIDPHGHPFCLFVRGE